MLVFVEPILHMLGVPIRICTHFGMKSTLMGTPDEETPWLINRGVASPKAEVQTPAPSRRTRI